MAHTKRTGANFFAQSVLSTDAEVKSMGRSVGHWMLVRSRGAGVSDTELTRNGEMKAEEG